MVSLIVVSSGSTFLHHTANSCYRHKIDVQKNLRKPVFLCTFPHTVCGPGNNFMCLCVCMCEYMRGLVMVTITTGVPGDGGCDIGVDRFPWGKEEHLTFPIHCACSTCEPSHVTAYTLSHINWWVQNCYPIHFNVKNKKMKDSWI